MKTVWLINQYASTPETGIGGRHHYLASELAKRGHDVYLIAARNHHLLSEPEVSAQKPQIEQVDGYKFVRLNTVSYKHAHDPRRILSWFVFSWRLARLRKKPILGRPDAILYSSPSPVGHMGAERVARHFKCRLVFEERDLWPMTLIDIGNISKWHPLMLFMQWVEDRAYRLSDAVVSNLPGAVEHMTSRGLEPTKFTWVANGISLGEVRNKEPLPPSFFDGFPQNRFSICFAGTLGVAQGLNTLISAAEILKNRDDIQFAFVGDGKEKKHIQNLVSEKKLTNVFFFPRVPKAQVQSVLENFDVCYISLVKSSVFKFGIAANKIFDYMYSGKPILHSYSGARDPIEEYKCGITVEAENPDAVARAIEALAAMPIEAREAMGKRGRAAVITHHEYGKLAAKLEAVLFPPAACEKGEK
ncbi:MAG: glycosyltransferase family 4 protein [Rhodobacteraceae bacterium]|nr:glycosyltransferase family 4 protein [Paracoccaceae bacterium]